MSEHVETYFYTCGGCGHQRSEPRHRFLDHCTCEDHAEKVRQTAPEAVGTGRRIEPVFNPGEWEED